MRSRFHPRLFTPKHPSTLPKSQWLSYTRLFSIVQPYAPARVWRQGRGNLKQLVIEWCQHHPAYVQVPKPSASSILPRRKVFVIM